jgi:hypothetical protein
VEPLRPSSVDDPADVRRQQREHLEATLGPELVEKLLGARLSQAPGVAHPDQVARQRLVVWLCDELAGSYWDFGIRRWFSRPRTLLAGEAPIDRLTGAWSPESPAVVEVCDLVRSLNAGGAS